MANEYHDQLIDDEDRRAFLKALGVSAAAAAGGIGLNDVRESMETIPAYDFASVGAAVRSDLAESLDSSLLAASASTFADEASALPTVTEISIPENGIRNEFDPVASAGRPIYDHLTEAGFFESTTQHLPAFNPSFLESAIQAFVGSEALSKPLAEVGLSEKAGTDLVATVIGNAEELSTAHWVATDELDRSQIEFGEDIAPMTQGAAGGVLLWLEDLDQYLWQKRMLLTDQIVGAASWYGRSMAAGFNLMTVGARATVDESSSVSDSDLGALLTTGFAIQAISQGLLPKDVYWLTDEMRADRHAGLERVLTGPELDAVNAP